MSALAQLNPWLGMLAVCVSMLSLMLGLRILQRRRELDPEIARKLFHMGGGALAVSLPWLFQESWPVLLLTGVTIGTFIALRCLPTLARGLGQVLHAVSRRSHGEFYFPLGVCLVFLLAGSATVPYVVSILVVAVADSFAALIGAAYGRHHFWGVRGGKTVEGSTAFFLASFLCIHVPLLLWTDTGGAESLLIGLNLALILMLAEAVARRGTDNLLLPVLTWVLLNMFLDKSALDLIVHLSAISCLSLLVSSWRFRAVLFRELMAPGVFK